MGDHSEEFIPIGERKWNDIPAFKGHTLESSISILVMKLVHHLGQKDRETDGAVHWNSRSEAATRVSK